MTTTLVPESAPFNEEQRAWLNGFLAGFLGISGGVSAPANGTQFGILDAQVTGAEEDLDDAPWHDPALAIDERMRLAEGQPLSHRLMAAMAQLDCGSCGYVCKSYSAAIAAGTESNLTLCSPGGKETKQLLKILVRDSLGESRNTAAMPTKAANASPLGTRQNPYRAKLLVSLPLNHPGSAKDTRHVSIDLGESGLKYSVGDALGVYPTNCPELADEIIAALGADPDTAISLLDGTTKTLKLALIEDCCLKEPTDELIATLLEVSDAKSNSALKLYASDGAPIGVDVLDLLRLVDTRQLSASRLVTLLAPLNPRLYSIASSMSKVGNQVHLTVGKVTYERDGRVRKGVASTMLADRIGLNQELRVFVQPNHGGFTLPVDHTAPIIMVGPGTGIAPFIAFLQEREAVQASGKNWLFFGDQHRELDFLYEEQLSAWQSTGVLTRLDTAFSRDSEKKVYVQDRMRENGAELWSWLNAGGYFFVCGDASRMAADVNAALKEIVAKHGNLNSTEAEDFLKKLSREKRYVRDVY